MRGRDAAVLAATLALVGGCAMNRVGTSPPAAAPGRLAAILDATPALAPLIARAKEHRLEIVLGTLEPAPGGGVRLVQDGFRLDAEYFYPASTVKLFGVVAALERLAELRRATGLAIDADTPLVVHPLFEGDVLEDADLSNRENGRITVGHLLRKILLVSDNAAFNTLYELVGQDRLAATLRGAGLERARIVHRLSEFRSPEENRRFPRIDLVGDGFVFTLPERTSEPLPPAPPVDGLRVGEGYETESGRVEGPMDFAAKNSVPLSELQRGLCMVVRPEADCGGRGFELAAADRARFVDAMTAWPRQSTNPAYDPSEYPDEYCKFFLPGLERVLPKGRLRISNKCGDAYGFLTDNAWIVDTESGRGFFLAATLYANADGILNDDHYDYETVSKPFLADLAEAVARSLWGVPAR